MQTFGTETSFRANLLFGGSTVVPQTFFAQATCGKSTDGFHMIMKVLIGFVHLYIMHVAAGAKQKVDSRRSLVDSARMFREARTAPCDIPRIDGQGLSRQDFDKIVRSHGKAVIISGALQEGVHRWTRDQFVRKYGNFSVIANNGMHGDSSVDRRVTRDTSIADFLATEESEFNVFSRRTCHLWLICSRS